MKRRILAVHEAGHAIMAHYAGMIIKKITLDETEGKIFAEEKKDRKPDGGDFILITTAGLIAQSLEFGNDFWDIHPKEDILKSSDFKRLQVLDLEKYSTKQQFITLLKNAEKYLATPHIWGKVDYLADEIIDHPNGFEEDEIRILIARCERERTPEHNASRLINFLASRLFS